MDAARAEYLGRCGIAFGIAHRRVIGLIWLCRLKFARCCLSSHASVYGTFSKSDCLLLGYPSVVRSTSPRVR
jgi:hypothetical protein